MKFRNVITAAALVLGTVTLGSAAQAMDGVKTLASPAERAILAEIARVADYNVPTTASVVEFNGPQERATAETIAKVAEQQRGASYTQSASVAAPAGNGES